MDPSGGSQDYGAGPKALGFRAETSAVNWAVVEGSAEVPILTAADQAAAPATYDDPAALAWFREHVRHLIATYSPQVVAIRCPETVMRAAALSSMYKRCRVEGVLMETAHSCGVAVVTGPLATISKNLGTKSAKKYLETDDLRGLNWSKYPRKCREAILVAASALPSVDH
jgi:Holliday junction resolvasome RuvABC endonuclease subunit